MRWIVGAALPGLLLTACQPTQRQEKAETSEAAVLQAPYSTVYYDSLQVAMDAYYDLTDGLTMANLTQTDKWAGMLQQHIDSLPFDALQMDSAKRETLRTNAGSISAELAGLAGEKTIDEKRVAFGMVSDMLFDLVKSTGLKGRTIYRQYCPMAFNDQGGYWLARDRQILNPYFGKDMTSCVQITDSLRYQ